MASCSIEADDDVETAELAKDCDEPHNRIGAYCSFNYNQPIQHVAASLNNCPVSQICGS